MTFIWIFSFFAAWVIVIRRDIKERNAKKAAIHIKTPEEKAYDVLFNDVCTTRKNMVMSLRNLDDELAIQTADKAWHDALDRLAAVPNPYLNN